MTSNVEVRSVSNAQVLDLICEGEIGGLVDGLKSIYLNDTPVQTSTGSLNFQNVQYVATTGTNSQGVVTGFDQVRNEIAVGVEVSIATNNITRTISNSDVSSVIVTVQFPALYYSNDKGGQDGVDVRYAVEYQPSGGTWNTAVDYTVSGKATTTYERQHRIKLTGSAPWNVRVRRITADASSLRTANKTVFKSYVEVIDAKLNYPNSAIVGVTFDSKDFSSIPRRGYDVKLLKIKIPGNATVRADGSLTYSGTWNGAFQMAWSANPAWCLYDLLTNERYGLGKFIPSGMIDKWGLYQIGQYCDALVPDGFGGTEPRFTCNVWINNRREAYQVINDMVSVFRGMPYWASGGVTITQDSPASPSYVFSNANVADGVFTYQGSSAKVRHTVALVTWNDPNDQYRSKVEYVEDTDAIARYGVIETEVLAIACTSRGQARRVGRWLLYSERYQTEVVSFKTGAEGALVRPGDIVTVADQDRAGVRLGGRVSSATSTTLTVDSLASVPAVGSTLYVVGADGVTQTRTISGVSGRVVTVSAAFSPVPVAQMPWIISTSAVTAQQVRIISVAETTDGEHDITGLEHDPAKYAYVELDIPLESRDYSDLNAVPSVVAAVNVFESLYTYQASVRSKLSISWETPDNAASYKVEWSKDGGNFQADTTQSTDFEVLNTTPGTYTIRVTPLGPFGKSALPTVTTFTALGKSAPPSDVSGLTTTTDPLIGVTLQWDAVTDLDLSQYEIRQGSDWDSAALVARVKATTYKLGVIESTPKTYLVKAIDTSGVYSTNAASVTTSVVPPTAVTVTARVVDNNILLNWTNSTSTLAIRHYEVRKGSTWAGGTVVGTIANGTFAAFFETTAGTYTYWVAAVDIGGNQGTPASVSAVMSQPPDYQLFLDYNSTLDGTRSNAVLADGSIWFAVNTTETVASHFTARSWSTPQDQINAGYPYFIEPTQTSGYYEETVDYGATVAAAKVEITPTYVTQFGTATVAPSLKVSADGTTWTDLGAVTAAYATNFRYVRFRLTVSASGGDDIVQVSAINFHIFVKLKNDAGTVAAVSSDSGGTTVTFGQTFTAVTAINCTPLGTTRLTAVYDFSGVANPTTFKVLLFDASGARASGTVSWTARGY